LRLRRLASPAVSRQNGRQAVGWPRLVGIHYRFDHVRDVEVADLPCGEKLDRHLVRGIQDRRHGVSDLEGPVGQAKTGKSFEVGIDETKRPRGEIESGQVTEIQPLWVREGVSDGNGHVGHRHLGDDRPVSVLDHRVNYALGVDEHIELRGRYVEEPPRFYELEAFVHQRGRVDRNLGSHLPRRMPQRLARRDGCQLLEGALEKRPPRGGQGDSSHVFQALPLEGLKNGVMLAIDRQDPHLGFARRPGHELPCYDEHFLVGERDVLSPLYSGQRGRETGGTHHRRYDQVSLGVSRNRAGSLLPPQDPPAERRYSSQ